MGVSHVYYDIGRIGRVVQRIFDLDFANIVVIVDDSKVLSVNIVVVMV